MGDHEEEDWDLYAVVRSCINSKETDGANTTTREVVSGGGDQQVFCCETNLTSSFGGQDFFDEFPNLYMPRQNGWQELQDSCNPFLYARSSTNSSTEPAGINHDGYIPIFSVHKHENPPPPPPPAQQQQVLVQELQLTNPNQQHWNQTPRPQHQKPPTPAGGLASNGPARAVQSQSNRIRKKKAKQKRVVVHIASDTLPTDAWAWRKYGQKPIKGSPFPRNYYRCSSSRGCSARKQVEKSSKDEGVYVVSYKGDHTHSLPTHRNSLAGGTRPRLHAPTPTPPTPTSAPAMTNTTSTTTLITAYCCSTHHTDQYEMVKAMEFNEDEEHGDNAGGGGGSSSSPMFQVDSDDEDYDGDHILIPNHSMAFVDRNQDTIIKGLQQLGSFTTHASTTVSPSFW